MCAFLFTESPTSKLHGTNNVDDGYFGSGIDLNRSIKALGKENFHKEIIQECSSYKEAFELEEKLVTLDLIETGLVYNRVPGGAGGVISASIAAKKKRQNPEHERRRISAISSTLKIKYAGQFKAEFSRIMKVANRKWIGRKHREESKSKIGAANAVHQLGSQNSMFGRIWIYHPVLRRCQSIKKIEFQQFETGGWLRGRKLCFTRCHAVV